MPDLAWNLRLWDRDFNWDTIAHGDGWSEMASFCGVPYDQWKDQLRRTFILPYVRPESTALEIGPGHGRWSVLLQPKVSTLHLVDLSPSCIAYCKQRLASHENIRYHVNDGKTIRMIDGSSLDYIWSFDTFVHVEEPEIRSYAKELHRVMKPQSMGVIHHSGNSTAEQRRNGCRSMVDGRTFGKILAENHLHVIRQVSEWGAGCNMALTGDLLTVFARP